MATMTKFINSVEDITKELLEGYVKAYPRQVKLGAENVVIRANAKGEDKVAVITLGGSGHEPALSGFVGDGMLDASIVGDVFAAPGAQRVFQALQMFKREAGILLVVLNHSGDVMSANMACQLAERVGIKVKQLLTHDDISAGLETDNNDRRGLAGCIPLFKILGAAADQGKTLDELFEIGQRFTTKTATLAVAMGRCTHPQNGTIISDLPQGEMEIGMGQHGEGGGGRQTLISADDTAEKMISLLLKKIQPQKGDDVLCMINGTGSTTLMEMSIVFGKCAQILEEKGLHLQYGRIDNILTVQEQHGFQMIFAQLDQDHVSYLNSFSSDAPYWSSVAH